MYIYIHIYNIHVLRVHTYISLPMFNNKSRGICTTIVHVLCVCVQTRNAKCVHCACRHNKPINLQVLNHKKTPPPPPPATTILQIIHMCVHENTHINLQMSNLKREPPPAAIIADHPYMRPREVRTHTSIYKRSITNAEAPPPPLQIPAHPKVESVLMRLCISVTKMRAPEQPMGCPRATAPPASMCMYVCMYVCMCVCVCVYIYIYIYIYTYTYIYTYVHIWGIPGVGLLIKGQRHIRPAWHGHVSHIYTCTYTHEHTCTAYIYMIHT